MRIGIDIRKAYGSKTGLGMVPYNLSKVLPKIDKDNRYIFFPSNPPEGSIMPRWLNAVIYELIYKQIILPIELFVKKVDIFLSTTPIIPFLAPCPTVVIIYDLSFYDPTANESMLLRKFFITLYKLIVKRATKVITVSRNSKSDIIRILNINDKKVSVIHLGGNYIIRENGETFENIKTKYNLKKKFILAVLGSFIPRKNFNTLLHAYHNLPQEMRSQYKLVIVAGKKGRTYIQANNLIGDLGLISNVIITGYVPGDELSLLYSRASLLVHPCLHEGFGLPLVEAMYFGVPIIASNKSSLPEIIGDAGIMVEASDVEAWSKSIIEILETEFLQQELHNKALQRAKYFTWEKTAHNFISLFNQMHNENKGNFFKFKHEKGKENHNANLDR